MTRPLPLVTSAGLLLQLLACGPDYQLHGPDGDGGPGDDDDSVPGDDDDNDVLPDDDTDPQGLCQDEYLPPLTTPTIPECEPPTVGTFTPVVEWSIDAFSVAPDISDIMAPPAIGNLTDDNHDGVVDDLDIPDIAVCSYGYWSTAGGVVRAISGDGTELWAAQVSAQGQCSTAIGDIDSDGVPDVVAVKDDQSVIALANDGSTKWTSQRFTADIPGECASPAIGDMDADGDPEVAVGRVILDGASGYRIGTGTRGKGSAGIGSTSFFADVDVDGVQELIAGNAAYARDGSTVYAYGMNDGYPAVADFDGDEGAEVVVVGPGSIALYDTTGPLVWGPVGIPGSGGGPPTVADFDGDGEPEIGVASFNAYTVFETDGSVRWTAPVQDASSGITGGTVFDFEGDGIAEVVFADEIALWVFSGPDGAVKLQETHHSSATWIEYPAIADVDRDGHAEIIYGRNPGFAGVSYSGIVVVGDLSDSWMPTRPVWNQHGYSITNVEDDGGIPVSPEPNWWTYNSFRSADLVSATGGAGADLFPLAEVCDLDCATFGNTKVAIYAFNQGTLDVDQAVRVALYKQSGGALTLLGTHEFAGPVASGTSTEGARLSFDAATMGDASLVVYVDDDGTGFGSVPECDEDNNVQIIAGPLCP